MNHNTVGLLSIGDRVEARFEEDDPDFYLATIKNININGTYHVKFDDGDELENVKSGHIRKILPNIANSLPSVVNLKSADSPMNDELGDVMKAVNDGIITAMNLSQQRKDQFNEMVRELAAKEVKLEASFREREEQLRKEIENEKHKEKQKLDDEYSYLTKEKNEMEHRNRLFAEEQSKFQVEKEETKRTNDELRKEKSDLLKAIEDLKKDHEDKLKSEAERLNMDHQVKLDTLTLKLKDEAQVALQDTQKKVFELEQLNKSYQLEIVELKEKVKNANNELIQKEILTKTLIKEKDELLSKFENEKNNLLFQQEQKINTTRKEADVQLTAKTTEIAQNYASLRARLTEEETKVKAAENAKKDIESRLDASVNTAQQLRIQNESLVKSRETLKEDFERHGAEWRMFFESNIESLRKQYHDVISVRVQSWYTSLDQNISVKIAELLTELNYMAVARYPYPSYIPPTYNDEMMSSDMGGGGGPIDQSRVPHGSPTFYQSKYIPQTPENVHLLRQPTPTKSNDDLHGIFPVKPQYDNSFDYGNTTTTTYPVAELSRTTTIRYPNIYDTRHPYEGGAPAIPSGGYPHETQRDREREPPSSHNNYQSRNNQQSMHNQEPESSNPAVNYPFAYYTPQAQTRPQSASSSRPYGWKPFRSPGHSSSSSSRKSRRDPRIVPS